MKAPLRSLARMYGIRGIGYVSRIRFHQRRNASKIISKNPP